MTYGIEIEKIGSDGYITRYVRRGRMVRFDTFAEAQAMAEHLDEQAHGNPNDGTYTRFEVIEIVEPPYRAERSPEPPPHRSRRPGAWR